MPEVPKPEVPGVPETRSQPPLPGGRQNSPQAGTGPHFFHPRERFQHARRPASPARIGSAWGGVLRHLPAGQPREMRNSAIRLLIDHQQRRISTSWCMRGVARVGMPPPPAMIFGLSLVEEPSSRRSYQGCSPPNGKGTATVLSGDCRAHTNRPRDAHQPIRHSGDQACGRRSRVPTPRHGTVANTG